MFIKEIFTPVRIAANGTLNLSGSAGIAGFTADVAGTLTLTINGVVMLTTPVTAGVFLPMPYAITGTSSIVLSGGAAGCAAVAQ